MANPVGPDIELLKSFIPLDSLPDEMLDELCNLSSLVHYAAGSTVFRQGEMDNQSAYLVEGRVRLYSDTDPSGIDITAHTALARHTLDGHQPHHYNLVVEQEAVVLTLDNAVLDYMLTWDQLSGHIGKLDSDQVQQSNTDRVLLMTCVAESSVLRKIPAPNIQQLLKCMQRLTVRAGEELITMGEQGDYFYFIETGTASVSRDRELAVLQPGSSFGEEALISGGPRNATVSMREDGSVLRLSKQDFKELLQEPLLQWLDVNNAREQVNKGAAWLDVRSVREYEHYSLPHAVSLPLVDTREGMKELDKSKHYICYCMTGRRSSAAAFLLGQAGYHVSILKGGLQVLPAMLRAQLGTEVA